MSTATERDLVQLIDQFATLPPWLATAVDPEQVTALLRERLPELPSTATLAAGPFSRLNLKNTEGRWVGTYNFILVTPGGEQQTVSSDGTLYAPSASLPDGIDASASAPFGTPGWRCWLPAQRLLLEYAPSAAPEPPPSALADPEQVRPLIERTLREQAPGYADVQIETCAVQVLAHKPGATTIFRYQLAYAPSLSGQSFRTPIIGKYYDGDKGENAYAGMVALWRSPLAGSDAVVIPEPLGYIAEQRTVLQGAVPEERNLEDLVREAVRRNDDAAWDEVTDYARKTAVALVALHRSGVQHPEQTPWEEMRKDAAKQVKRVTAALPNAVAGLGRLFDRIGELHAATPPDPLVPSHGAFRPEQVLVANGRIGFIDFDRFCMAEPALDISRFRVVLKTYGSHPRFHTFADRAAILQRLEQLEAVNDAFLAAYEALAPVSRQRVALWEVLHHIYDLARSWNKTRAEDRSVMVLMLQRHLRALGL